jgi:protein transport protein SEC24
MTAVCSVPQVAPPVSKAVLDKTGLPFALLATPFADPEHGEKSVPLVDLGPLPPRCTRCRAYVNSAVTWGENGNCWTCNLCSMVNETPPWYAAPRSS